MSEATYTGGDADPEKPPVDGAAGGSGEGSTSRRTTYGGIEIDTTYPRSIEGILKIVTVAVAVVGLILTFIAWASGPGGWYIFVGFGYIVYVVIVFVIEMFIAGVYVHRLIDGVIVIAYSVLWALTAFLNLGFAAHFGIVVLGISVIFSVACSVLCAVQAVFAFRTWRTYEDGRKGSQPIFVF